MTVGDKGEGHAAIRHILAEANVGTVALSDFPLLDGLAESLRDSTAVQLPGQSSADELFACDAGVTGAQWGIAETGTLVLESGGERSRLLSLIPPLHVALLRASCICETLGDALARVRGQATAAEVPNRAVTLITGPSRTSDIELMLAIGVHGPQVLCVVVIDDR